MKTKEILLFENGSGGTFSNIDNDLTMVERIYYKVYISLFGGNTESSTKGNEIQGEERSDWWANSLIFPEEPSKQFNSETERVLREVALNSKGRMLILQAVKNDLKLFQNISQIEVNVVILSTNSVSILVKINEPINNTNSLLKMVWDNAKSELITQITI